MKNNDDIKLDVTSNIDEKIIDEVTDKKISLLQKSGGTTKNLRKRFIAIGSIAASFVLMFSVLLVIIIPLLVSDVPVYQGMTIRQESSSSMKVQDYGFHDNGITLLSASRGNNGFVFLSNSNGNGNAYGHDKDNHKDKDDKPKNDIEDIVVIDVKTDDEVRYYVKPGETFIIEIHIDNPRDYEIQSFTLNGQKYANYMFKEGSTMELLLLEVTAPDEPGYVEYTIDAIKYIDGTEIKDVDMSSGDKSVKAGIAYPAAPSASVTSQTVMPTSIALSVNISDPYSLIGENELSLYLTDGESVISSKPLIVGENNITFDNLSMNKTYEYGVVTAYDLVDGKNLHKEWLLTSTVTTAGAFGISNAIPTQDSITFEVEKISDVGEITSISLFDAETNDHVASGGADIREFTGLLSNHTYNLYVDFKYTIDGKENSDWVAIKGIKTVAKTEPTVKFDNIDNINVTDSTIVGNFSMNDPDLIGAIISVSLYKGDTLVKDNASKEIKFSGLESNTDYKIAVTYTFDLHDGTGVHTKTATRTITTYPHLEFNSCKILNNQAVIEGDTIFMQITIDNPSGAIPKSVVINGQTYPCSGTANASIAEIKNDGQFEGGNTTLTVQKVYVVLDGKTFTVIAEENNTASLFINSKLEVDGIELAIKDGEAYITRDYFTPAESENVYALITLSNKTGYTIDSVKLHLLTNEETQIYNDLIKIDNEHYALRLNSFSTVDINRIKYQIKEITYHNEYVDKTSAFNSQSNSVIRLMSDTVKEVSTPDDLLNMNEGYYYRLTNDIDLSGISWVGSDFYGFFDGNGHSITNMSRIEVISLPRENEGMPIEERAIGLFTRGNGVIINVNLKSVTFIITAENASVKVGALVGNGRYNDSYVCIDNCHIDNESNIIVRGTHYANVGGLAGEAGTVKNSSSYANMLLSVNSAHANGSVCGIVGYADIVDNCTNYGDVTAEKAGATGIGHGNIVNNCTNRGDISGNANVAGVGNGTVINCENHGKITCTGALENTDSNVGGIGNDGTFEKCVNYGTVSGIKWVGGIGNNGTFKACANYGAVSCTGYAAGDAAGGIAGGGGTVENCINYGRVSGYTSAAGITAGGWWSDFDIKNCANFGNITAESDYGTTDCAAGGISGAGVAQVDGCINHGSVSGKCYVGNIAGYSEDAKVNNCYGSATASQLNSKSFYTDILGWSEDVWNLDDLDIENGKYPTLK